jgi:MOSC domain-containing protein YiiM
MTPHFEGRLVAIAIHPARGAPMARREAAAAVAGCGLIDDCYAAGGQGSVRPDQEVTLIEQEAIDAACRDYELSFDHLTTRRNLLTAGVPLNHLVGREFAVGEVILRGVELCEPCGHLEQLTIPGIKRALVHRGGLRAHVVRSGTVRVGDRIAWAGRVDRGQ